MRELIYSINLCRINWIPKKKKERKKEEWYFGKLHLKPVWLFWFCILHMTMPILTEFKLFFYQLFRWFKYGTHVREKEFGGGLLQKPQNTCIIKYNKLRRQTMQNASFYFHCSMQSSSTNREYLDTIIVIWGCMWTNKEKHKHWLGINVLSSKPPTNINMPFTHTNTYAYQGCMNNKKYTHTHKETPATTFLCVS